MFRNIKYHEQRFIIEVWAARFGFVILDTNFIGAPFLWENFWIECKRQTESHAIRVMASAMMLLPGNPEIRRCAKSALGWVAVDVMSFS